MRKLLCLLLSLILLLSFAGCMAHNDVPAAADGPTPVPTQETPSETPKESESPSAEDAGLDLHADTLMQVEKLTLALLQIGMAEDTSGNVAFSPMDVSLSLAALYAGSTGDTAEQLRSLAGFTAEPDDVLSTLAELRKNGSANFVLSDRFALADGFSTLAQGAGVRFHAASFGSQEGTDSLNAAAGSISPAFAGTFSSTTPSDTFYILTGSAPVAAFATPFPTLERYAGLFDSPDGLVPCDFLYTEGEMPYYEDELVQICAYPLADSEKELLLILPKEGSMTDTMELLGHYGGEWLSAESLEPYPIRLSLPALALKQQNSLRETLLALGMILPFNPTAADFSAMLETAFPLSVSNVYSLVELNLTETGVNHAGDAPEEANFIPSETGTDLNLNRPFLLALRDNGTGAIDLVAWINTPK